MSNLSYCRFCAEQKNTECMIFINNESIPEILEKLSFLGVDYVDFSNNNLPETLCKNCLSFLNIAYEYFVKVKNSQNKLYSFKIEKQNCEEVSSLDEKNCSLDTNNWENYPWSCECGLLLDSLEQLRAHSKIAHMICLCFKCADCQITNLKSIESVIEHIREHREELRYFCPYCNIKIERDPISEHSHENVLCKACGEQFLDNSLYQEHVSRYLAVPENCEVKIEMVHGANSDSSDWKHYDSPEESKIISFKQEKQKSSSIKKLKKKKTKKHKQLNNIDNEAWSTYTWICRHCRSLFPDSTLLREHSLKEHNDCFAFACADCDYELKDFREFVTHARDHQPILKSHCEYCNRKYDDDGKMLRHSRKHRGQLKHCNRCGDLFPSREEQARHLESFNLAQLQRQRRRQTPITAADLTCKVCAKVLKSTHSVRLHEATHAARARDFECEVCGKTFFAQQNLAAHRRIHDAGEAQPCRLCGKAFLTLARLRKHVQTHLAKRFQCEQCQRRFTEKHQLKSHMLVHGDRFPFPCALCPKAFKFRNVWKLHQNQHTGARPYSCDLCCLNFSSWANANKHSQRRHGRSLAKTRLTPRGKLSLDPATGQPQPLADADAARAWSEQVMTLSRRRTQ